MLVYQLFRHVNHIKPQSIIDTRASWNIYVDSSNLIVQALLSFFQNPLQLQEIDTPLTIQNSFVLLWHVNKCYHLNWTEIIGHLSGLQCFYYSLHKA